jgi:hypothetical protein
MTNINYMQTVPNSYWWTDLNQILQHSKYLKDGVGNVEPLTPEYLLIGLNNSIKHGYKIKQVKNLDLNQPNHKIFISIDKMIDYLNNEFPNEEEFCEIINTTINVGLNLTNGLKMERREVYKRVDGERNYQDMRWNTNLREGDVPDEEKPVAEWLNYIEYHLSKAKDENYHLNKEASLAELRKITALAVRCLEIHGCPERISTEGNPILVNESTDNINGTSTSSTFIIDNDII